MLPSVLIIRLNGSLPASNSGLTSRSTIFSFGKSLSFSIIFIISYVTFQISNFLLPLNFHLPYLRPLLYIIPSVFALSLNLKLVLKRHRVMIINNQQYLTGFQAVKCLKNPWMLIPRWYYPDIKFYDLSFCWHFFYLPIINTNMSF